MTRPLRAVVDTNVLIAAAIKPTGTCRELLDAAVGLRWQPVLSPQLLSELETVIATSEVQIEAHRGRDPRFHRWPD